jgi:hypothetical protein
MVLAALIAGPRAPLRRLTGDAGDGGYQCVVLRSFAINVPRGAARCRTRPGSDYQSGWSDIGRSKCRSPAAGASLAPVTSIAVDFGGRPDGAGPGPRPTLLTSCMPAPPSLDASVRHSEVLGPVAILWKLRSATMQLMLRVEEDAWNAVSHRGKSGRMLPTHWHRPVAGRPPNVGRPRRLVVPLGVRRPD